MQVKSLEVELRSMKEKENKVVGQKLTEFEALLKAEMDQLPRKIKATLDAENADWRKEIDLRMEEEVKMMEQMEKTLRAELKSREEWGKQVDAKMEEEVKMMEQMEKELRAEFKLGKEELKMKLEEQRTATTKSLQNMTYAFSRALLKNVSLFFSRFAHISPFGCIFHRTWFLCASYMFKPPWMMLNEYKFLESN